MTSNFVSLRQRLVDENVLTFKGEYFEFPEDYIFS